MKPAAHHRPKPIWNEISHLYLNEHGVTGRLFEITHSAGDSFPFLREGTQLVIKVSDFGQIRSELHCHVSLFLPKAPPLFSCYSLVFYVIS